MLCGYFCNKITKKICVEMEMIILEKRFCKLVKARWSFSS